MIKSEKWQKDLSVYQDINTTFIIEGNVHDKQPWVYEDDGSYDTIALSDYLHRYLSQEGYDPVIFYNRVDGFHNPFSSHMVKTFYRGLNATEESCRSLEAATDAIRKTMGNTVRPTAVILDMANTIASAPDNLSDMEAEHFSRLMLASKNQTQALSMADKRPLTNLLFLIVEKVNDIPAWFYLNNPYVRTLTISRPENAIRAAVISSYLDLLSGATELSREERKEIEREFTSLTDGMTLVELYGISTLCRQKNFSVWQIKSAIKMFRYGETESHWDKLDLAGVRKAETFLSRRVKGQASAIRKAADVLSRACLGLSGIQGGSSGRPKGVLFFAGPTGTGKTELAKTISEFIFGDESFVTRFDISEYQQPHSDQRLLGAPPGYVGYSAGGQLTNAVKAKPFCVLLFDEIDKAHPSILDKFLQILEDGRITDSSGETVYFSEALIIFTSNLGLIGERESDGLRHANITPDMKYEEIEKRLLESIRDYFKFQIQRPELLNRIGDNFVIFDFISKEAAKEILLLKLNAIAQNLERDKALRLIISDVFTSYLYTQVLHNLDNGGRGIGNVIETKLVNPLSRILIQERWKAGDVITIKAPAANGLPIFTISAGTVGV
ncbi:MAG: AAA family ATPase [Clostridiales bacterium]|nr:AAA family ATPase [Clostridiales bacterium]